ncbi:MAG: response regulator, partial [Candidatus Contendobacter sp.]|nr:response regulator [Candidatus Contendobacter sp.]
ILCIALISTFELRDRVSLLVNEGVPLMQASSQVLAGVQHSFANLRGWISLRDQKFLDGWQAAWREDIQPALALLNRECQQALEQACDPQRLHNLKTLLADLRESQWWVQDIAHTPGNDPARVVYLLDVEPSANKLNSVIAALLEEEIGQDGGSERKILLARLAELQNAFAATRLLLREILGGNGLNYEDQFRQQLEWTTTTVAQLAVSPLPTPEQFQLLNLLQMELRAFTQFAQEVIRIRRSPNWNIAMHTLAQETDPLANQAIALASALAANSRMRMEREAEAASAASSVTVGNLMVLIFTMLAVAYVLSRQRAESLALPLIALAKATRRLADGSLNQDIPVDRNDEIGELTCSFNTMRASMQQAHAELREANALLEQRVSERTAQLATTNDSLTWEIAEHQQTEKALRESEARLLAITKAIPDLVFVVDEEGCYREILAARRDQIAIGPLRGKLLSQVHSPEMAEFFLDIIRRALATQRIQIAEYELATPSGLRWFESRTAPLEVQFDAKSAAIVVARDITQRKQSEAQLRQAQKMQAIGQLTGGIAHDFNNLLAIIMGNLELLHEQLTAQPRLYQLTQQALKAVDRGANLSRRLLAFARRQPLLAQPTDLNQRVLGMLDLMRRTLGATIQIDTLLAADLEQTLIDPGQLENALLNLVINARDAMPQGGRLTLETANVRLDADYAAHEDVRPGSYVMLAVSDTGAGMTPEVLEHVFEPFFTTKETGKGSGLGLSMVYGLVKQSGGHITIYSEPGQGATVRLYLPPTPSAATPVAEPPVADSEIQGQGETILVVEDDADVRLFAVNALQGMGYETQQAGEAETAIRLLETTPQIALLFTDIVLPGEMDGVRLAAEAQRRYPGLRVLFTSGYTEHALIGSGQLAEGVDVLTKPYRKTELGKKLRTLLDGAKPEDNSARPLSSLS